MVVGVGGPQLDLDEHAHTHTRAHKHTQVDLDEHASLFVDRTLAYRAGAPPHSRDGGAYAEGGAGGPGEAGGWTDVGRGFMSGAARDSDTGVTLRQFVEILRHKDLLPRVVSVEEAGQVCDAAAEAVRAVGDCSVGGSGRESAVERARVDWQSVEWRGREGQREPAKRAPQSGRESV
jgi:hypothetical protein